MPYIVTRHSYCDGSSQENLVVEIARGQKSSENASNETICLPTNYTEFGEGRSFINPEDALLAAVASKEAWEQREKVQVQFAIYRSAPWSVDDYTDGPVICSFEEALQWVKNERTAQHLCARPGCIQRLHWLDGIPLSSRGWLRLEYTYCSARCHDLDQERASVLLTQHDPLERAPLCVLRQDYDDWKAEDEIDQRRAVLTRAQVEALLATPNPLWTLARSWQERYPGKPLGDYEGGDTPLCTLLECCFQIMSYDYRILDINTDLVIEDDGRDGSTSDDEDRTPFIAKPQWAQNFSALLHENRITDHRSAVIFPEEVLFLLEDALAPDAASRYIWGETASIPFIRWGLFPKEPTQS